MKTQKPKAYSYIRFSTPEQLKGDSLRRQKEASEKYAKEKGLTLDTTLNMQDLGLSAFKGTNKTKGALGQFLQLVKEEKIPKGSILIVENLDRLSREQVSEALTQFMNLINSDIHIVTLQDGQEYSKKSIQINWTQLIISITYMARGWEESEAKSKRLKATWDNKRNEAIKNGKILTKNMPYWLRINKKGKFEKIPTICNVIEYIYKLRLDGLGAGSIAIKLNQMKDIWKPPISKRNKTGGWAQCYIIKILKDKRLIGEFQPFQKKIPVGESIPNYYPAIIEEKLFFAVQEYHKRNAKRPGNGGGYVGKANNVFAGLLKCGNCGGGVHYIGNKHNQYLQCDRSRRKLSNDKGERLCQSKPVRYEDFLRIVFSDLEELDISEITENGKENKIQISNLRQNIEALNFQLSELEKQQENLVEEIGKESESKLREALKKRYNNLDLEIISLQEEIKEATDKLNEVSANGANLKDGLKQAKDVYSLLQSMKKDNDKAIELRLRLREILRRIIKEIRVYPLEKRCTKVPQQEEIEPGIIQWTNDKHIKKISIRFKGSKKLRILQLQGISEVFE